MKTNRFEDAPFLVSTGENGGFENGDEKLKASYTVQFIVVFGGFSVSGNRKRTKNFYFRINTQEVVQVKTKQKR